MRRVGIMGGTFDPIHIGHLRIGETAYEEFGLDEIWYLPAGNPPHKRNRLGRASDRDRVDMVRAAIADNPHFRLSLAEMETEGYTYTYRTLERLRAEYPDTEFFFLIGGDSLRDFASWREPGRICAQASLIVAGREEIGRERLLELIKEYAERYHGRFLPLTMPNLEISSRDIRERVKSGRSVRYLVPEAVRTLIQERKIYQDEEQMDGTV